MRPKLIPILILYLLCGGLRLAAADELCPEQPDCGFFIETAYTQPRRSFEVATFTEFFDFRSPGFQNRTLSNYLTLTYGFTDRLEGSVYGGYSQSWTEREGVSSEAQGPSDTFLLLRYQILSEASSPITLSLGPLLALPTGDFSDGFGQGGLGVGFDLSIAKEWHPLFYQCFNVNYLNTLQVPDPPPNSFRNFNMNHFYVAMSLGFRPLEKFSQKGNRHDIHVTVETIGFYDQFFGSLAPGDEKHQQSTFQVIPGVKYGFFRKDQKFYSIVGVAVPFGLDSDAADWGVLVQTQFGFQI